MLRMHRMLMLLTVLLAVVAATAIATPAQAASYESFRNYGNRKCVDVAAENHHLVQLWNCNGSPRQHWKAGWVAGSDLDLWVLSETGGCLAVEGDATFAQARVVLMPCGYPSTVWHNNYAFNDSGPNHAWHQQLKNVNSGLCLDLQWNSSANGTPIWLWPCNDSSIVESNTAQLWMLP